MRRIGFLGGFAACILFVASGTAGADGSFSTLLSAREDYLRWSISDADGHPNILSELTWENLRSKYISFHGEYEKDDLVMGGMIGSGAIDSGDNQDSDYNLDNRQGEFSRSNNASNGDRVSDVEFKFGFRFLTERPVRLGAGVGFAYHTLDLVMRDGQQTIPATGTINNLNSSYDATLSGPIAWFQFNWRVSPMFRLGAERKIGFMEYEGTANWNLRDDFKHPRSFYQHSNGLSDGISVWGDVMATRNVAFKLQAAMQRFTASGGYTRFYMSDGSIPQQPVHRVEQTTWSVGLGATITY